MMHAAIQWRKPLRGFRPANAPCGPSPAAPSSPSSTRPSPCMEVIQGMQRRRSPENAGWADVYSSAAGICCPYHTITRIFDDDVAVILNIESSSCISMGIAAPHDTHSCLIISNELTAVQSSTQYSLGPEEHQIAVRLESKNASLRYKEHIGNPGRLKTWAGIRRSPEHLAALDQSDYSVLLNSQLKTTIT